MDARVLTQGGGDQALEGLAWYFAAAHEPIEHQSVHAGQQDVSAILDIRHIVCGEEQSDGLAAGILAGREDLPQFEVAHALDGAGIAGWCNPGTIPAEWTCRYGERLDAVPYRGTTAQADGWMRVRTAWMQSTTT